MTLSSAAMPPCIILARVMKNNPVCTYRYMLSRCANFAIALQAVLTESSNIRMTEKPATSAALSTLGCTHEFWPGQNRRCTSNKNKSHLNRRSVETDTAVVIAFLHDETIKEKPPHHNTYRSHNIAGQLHALIFAVKNRQ